MKKRIFFLSIFLMIILSAVVGWAADWYVRPAGGNYGNEDGTSYENAWDGFSNIDWPSIQPGDTLWLDGNATYAENRLYVQASGSSGSPITIDGSYGGGRAVIASTDNSYHAVYIENQSYITLKNLDVSHQQGLAAIFIGAQSGQTTSHIDLINCSTYDSYIGISINGADEDAVISNINIKGGVYRDHSHNGIYIKNADDILIKNVLINHCNTNAYTWGIYCVGYHISETTGWTNLSGNIYYKSVSYTPLAIAEGTTRWLTENDGNYDSLADGEWDYDSGNLYINIGKDPEGVLIKVVTNWSSNITVEDSVCCNIVGLGEGTGIGADLGTRNFVVRRCIVYNNRQTNIYSMFCNGTTIEYCLAYDSVYGYGIKVRNSYDNNPVYIYNCTVSKNSKSGIEVDGGVLTTVYNCISVNNDEDEFSLTRVSGDLTAGYNCNGGGTYNANWEAKKGIGNIEQDPLFTSNYRLSRNSSCIDAATKLSIHDENWQDLAGNTVRYGTAPDIGCYEYKTWPLGPWGTFPWMGKQYKIQWTPYE